MALTQLRRSVPHAQKPNLHSAKKDFLSRLLPEGACGQGETSNANVASRGHCGQRLCCHDG
jgi:hypothetical protein